ncbi:MAG: hypothetical protein WC998_07845 [Candidatus Paceibacterota bacterium]|jgi:hypothetical protein
MKNIVSYGGGTQSTAMILMALNGDYGLQRPNFGVYADTGGEPEFINEYVRYFVDYVKQKYDFDIFITKYKDGIVNKLTLEAVRKAKSGLGYTSSNPPYFTLNPDGTKGMMMRQCTVDFKTNPISKLINSKLERGENYRIWIGISFDERSRMKISMKKRRTNYYPLVDNFIRRNDSINYVKKLGIKSPLRSSCFFCPFHSDRYWQWLKDFHPSEFERAVEFEKTVQERQNDYATSKIFLHRSCINLDQVIFTDKDQLNMFPELIDECGGECGI